MRTGLIIGSIAFGLAGCAVHQADWAREFGIALCKHEQDCRRVSASVDCTRPGFWQESTEELEALREGLVVYSPTEARRCIDLIATAGCIDDLKSRVFLMDECRAAFSGQLEEGKPCTKSTVDVCRRDAKCTLPRGQFTGACGTCETVAKMGEEVALSLAKDCGPGLYLAASAQSTTGSCQRRRTLGESCSLGQPCLELLDCSGVSQGTCVKPPPPSAGRGELGELCLTAFGRQPQCAWPATCDQACLSASDETLPRPGGGVRGESCSCIDSRVKVGEACDLHSQCELNAGCMDGRCVIPSAQEGETCAPTGCTMGLSCDTDFLCRPAFSLCR